MFVDLKDRTFLIIDDDEKCLEITNKLFSNFVDNICLAQDIVSAMKIFETQEIDCIVCDIFLGSDNGLDFISNIRKQNPNLPIIVFSGHIEKDYLLKAIPLNLIAYLQKPIEQNFFINTLQVFQKRILISENSFTHIKNNYYYCSFSKVIKKENKIYNLHQKEILFFEMILVNRNSLITKDMFYEYVWQFSDMSDSALKNFILRLRRRFGKNFIEAVKNIGYRI